MTDKTQPTAHAEITAPISADMRGMESGAQPAPITYMTEDRACKWAWEQVQQDVGTKGWTAGDSGNFFGFFLWGWSYRGQYETQRPAAPPAPAAVAVPTPIAAGMKAAAELVQEQADLYIAEHAETDPDTGAVIWHHLEHGFDWHNGLEELAQKLLARAALAAAPARASDTESVLIDGIAYEVPAAVAGELLSLHLDLLAAAPAQAVAVQPTWINPVSELLGHLSDVLPDSAFDKIDTAKWNAVSALVGTAAPAQAQDDRAAFKAYLQECDDCAIVPDVAGAFNAGWTAATRAPAQEHATQLAGQGANWEALRHSANEWADMAANGLQWLRNIVDGTSDAATALANMETNLEHCREVSEDSEVQHAIRAAAAPAQAQEDACDPVRALIATHAEMLEDNAYAYFELAYTRQTGWMAWITDKPLYGAPVVNPDRKVLANGQGDTPDEACADAARAAQGGAA